MHSVIELKKFAKQTSPDAPKIRVALLGDTSTQLLATSLKGLGFVRGYNVDIFESEYNQVERQLLDQSSELYQFDPEFIVVFQSTHKLLELHSRLNEDQQSLLAKNRLDFISSICASPFLGGKKIIYFNYPEIDDMIFGSYANKVVSSFSYQVRKLNYELMLLSQKFTDLFICDISSLQNKVGRDTMYAANIYMTTELVISTEILPHIASRVMDIICSIKGQIKKCLILDLDNTLWGGVIGDDGMEGIQLGHGLGIGQAFSEFQLWVKKLKQRGIIICIASKNDENIAKEPFVSHPNMELKLEDIAVFQANWDSKVDSVRTIQQILNISFDSMVFIDDNPFERNVVRDNIPGITVPEMPDDPAYYLEFLYSLNLFETAAYSNADKDRTKLYQVEAQRVSLSKSFTNEDDFLRSLDMSSSVSGFSRFNIPRVSQLCQRSNQFNLRTIRYTEADISAFALDPNVIDICFTMEDRFGDNGLIAVVIMKPIDKETLFVDTWLMSCRVLKRGMELFSLNIMVERARAAGYKKIVGEYLPTSKNKLVENHYSLLGFTKIEGATSSKYILDVNSYQNKDTFIKRK